MDDMTVNTHPRTVRLRTAKLMCRDEFRTINKCLDRLASMFTAVGMNADSETAKGAAKLIDSMKRLTSCNFDTLVRAMYAEEENNVTMD